MSTTPDTLANTARAVVALLDAGTLVLSVTDEMDDEGLAAACAILDAFMAATAAECEVAA